MDQIIYDCLIVIFVSCLKVCV